MERRGLCIYSSDGAGSFTRICDYRLHIDGDMNLEHF